MDTQTADTPEPVRPAFPLRLAMSLVVIYLVAFALLRSYFLLESCGALLLAVFCFVNGRPTGRRQWLVYGGCLSAAVALLLLVRVVTMCIPAKSLDRPTPLHPRFVERRHADG